MKVKIVTLVSLFVASFFTSTAQLRLDPFFPYSKWGVGFGAGYSQLYGNLSTPNSGGVMKLQIDHNGGPWTKLSLNVQHGDLSDYESTNKWTTGMSVTNSFTSIDLNGRLAIGAFLPAPRTYFAKTLYSFYVGVGIGYMFNNITNITMRFKNSDKMIITDYNEDYIKKNSSNFFMPFNFGFDLHITKRCVFNANYNFSYAFSDYLDGYNFNRPIATNKYNSMFSVLSFGLDFYIGELGTGKRHNTRTRK